MEQLLNDFFPELLPLKMATCPRSPDVVGRALSATERPVPGRGVSDWNDRNDWNSRRFWWDCPMLCYPAFLEDVANVARSDAVAIRVVYSLQLQSWCVVSLKRIALQFSSLRDWIPNKL